MSVVARVLISSQYVLNDDSTEYTAPASTRTIIDKVTVTNVTGGAVTVSIYLIPSGGAVDDEYKIIDTKSIAANTTEDLTDLKNHVLDTGDFISTIASAADSIVIRASGREVSS